MKTNNKLTSILFFFAIFFAAPAFGQDMTCVNNSDCKDGKVCRGGKCLDAPPPKATSTTPAKPAAPAAARKCTPCEEDVHCSGCGGSCIDGCCTYKQDSCPVPKRRAAAAPQGVTRRTRAIEEGVGVLKEIRNILDQRLPAGGTGSGSDEDMLREIRDAVRDNKPTGEVNLSPGSADALARAIVEGVAEAERRKAEAEAEAETDSPSFYYLHHIGFRTIWWAHPKTLDYDSRLGADLGLSDTAVGLYGTVGGTWWWRLNKPYLKAIGLRLEAGAGAATWTDLDFARREVRDLTWADQPRFSVYGAAGPVLRILSGVEVSALLMGAWTESSRNHQPDEGRVVAGLLEMEIFPFSLLDGDWGDWVGIRFSGFVGDSPMLQFQNGGISAGIFFRIPPPKRNR